MFVIFKTKWYYLLSDRQRRRKAGMPTDICLFSNSFDPIVPILTYKTSSIMSVDDGYDNLSLHENLSHNGERLVGGTAREFLTRMELDLAYSSEKILNLEILMMQVADRASDYEIQANGSEELSAKSIEKAFEFDILTGILKSEVKEIEDFMTCLQFGIASAKQNFIRSEHLEESALEIEEKLHVAEESLRNSQDQVADIRKQSEKFEKSLAFDENLENGQASPMNSKWKLQTVEQQRHLLQSLEKSLAREMDLEKKLSETRYNEEELKTKLHFANQEAYCINDFIDKMTERMFAAENAVELLLGISKELTGKLQNAHFCSSNSMIQEWDMKSDVGNGVKLSAEDKGMAAISEVSTLKDKVNVLKKQLKESETELQIVKDSETGDMENIIDGLREDVLELKSRAESAEARCSLLVEHNVQLNVEVEFLKNNGTEKAYFLERKLKESDTQLEHAKASVEAIEEQQNMLYSSLNDMGNLIEDLKVKVSKAENRAESAETKCTLLTETNLELNEELGFLRGRLECLEASLHQADREKIATVKDISNRAKLISELVKKLALERERLQLQISTLTKMNKILSRKCPSAEDGGFVNREKANYATDHVKVNSSHSISFQVNKPISDKKSEPAVSAEGLFGAVSNIELVRTIEAAQLNCKYFLMAFIVLLVSVLAVRFLPFASSST